MLLVALTVTDLDVPELVIAAPIVTSPADAASVKFSVAVMAAEVVTEVPVSVVTPLNVLAPDTVTAPALEVTLSGELNVFESPNETRCEGFTVMVAAPASMTALEIETAWKLLVPGVPTDPVRDTAAVVISRGKSLAVFAFAPIPKPKLSLVAVEGLPDVEPFMVMVPEPVFISPLSQAMP